jgi:ribosome modulation factor
MYDTNIWQEGRLAYLDGYARGANPYRTEEDRKQWRLGWDSAEEDYSENEGELQ